MGCDIHIFTEMKKQIGNRWVNVDHFSINPYYGEDEETEFKMIEIYGDRNYELFSMLANVRNYHNRPVISPPKGFPNDCSYFVNQEKQCWEGDGHSHSYFTLRELKEFKEYDVLVPLIERLEGRTREVFLMDENQDTDQYDDKIRIVFWFDN